MKTQPTVVTYSLEASEFDWQVAPGKTIKAWGFNNQVPGPVLKARKGDTLVVNVKNNLTEPTLIHWHGIRLPASMDGTADVQTPIEPGAEFEYRFVVPDAGTFWYHSHVNETVQLERGLYGGLVVEEDTELVTDEDRLFLLDDMKLTTDHAFSRPSGFITRFIERHDGREGETVLVNGKEQSTIHIRAGQTERWRFVNASSARYIVLHLSGRSFQLVGTDGGLLEYPRPMTEILLTPGERIEMLAGPFAESDQFSIESLPYDRVTFLRAKRRTLATVYVGTSMPSSAYIPDRLRTIAPLATQDAIVTRRVKLSVSPSLKNGLDFLVNNAVHTADKPVKVGELQIWEVANSSLMDHPFHLHGFFFQIIDENGKAPDYLAWKDTYNLPPRSTIKIAWMPDNRPGIWMYHCHILEHHAAGMMAHFEVIDGDNPTTAHQQPHRCSSHP